MLDAGGYWRPLAAVARLLEELGELVELLVEERVSEGALASELADLWIITTALADQYRIAIGDPQGPVPLLDAPRSAAGLLITAGQIARVVNFYDGPKLPRSPGDLPSLTEAIGAFHGELELLCGTLRVDLAHAVSEKFAVIHGRDMKRFAREDSDPSTAAVLARLPPSVAGRRLWGGPAARPGAGGRDLAQELAPSLLAFTRAARAEGLEGYVIALPGELGSAELTRALGELRAALGEVDPGPAPSGDRSNDLHYNGASFTLDLLQGEPQGDEEPGPETLALLRLRDGGVLVSPADDLRGAGDD